MTWHRSNAGDHIADDETFTLPFLDRLKSTIAPRLSGHVPEHLIERYGDTLRKASELYHFDAGLPAGGTTAPAVADVMESLRYWAFDLLWAGVSVASYATPANPDDRRDTSGDETQVPRVVLPSLLKRVDAALRGYVNDAKLRGQMPLGR